MDRPIGDEVKRRRALVRALQATAALAVVAGTLLGARTLLTPSTSRSRIRTARVTRAAVEATISGSGTVVPEFEQVISSPIDARVLRVLKRPGARVAAGEPILELDVAAPVLFLEKLSETFAQKENAATKARLALETTLASLSSQVEIKPLQEETYAARRERNETLCAQGLVSEELLRQSRLEEARARLEKKHLETASVLARRTAETEERALALEQATLAKEREEARRQLQLATTRADRSGVLTAIPTEPGATVRRGDVLARIADLSSFRVDVAVSDVHASRVSPGLPAVVDIGDTRLTGRVARVLPKIENGVLTVEIALDDASSPLLHASLKVEARLVLARKESALRIPKGRLEGSGVAPELFVVRGATAYRKPVTLGLIGADFYEIASGLEEGDEVVISDMSAYGDARKVEIR
jgi:HlyD family secretion protein